MLRLCVDVRSVPPGAVNGTGVYALELIRHLRQRLDVSLLATREQARDFEGEDVRLVESAAQCDVLHRPSQFNIPGHLDAFLESPSANVITYLDLIAYRTPSLFPSAGEHRRYCALSFAALHSAQEVIAISQHARRELVEELRLPPERVHAIPLAVDAAFFGAPAPRKRARPYFLCPGSDYLHKNLAALLRGYAWLRATWKPRDAVPDLVLTGPSSGVRGGVFAWGGAPAAGVQYLGVVAREELPGLYQHAVALVYPSTYEGFGLPVLEAMAAGTPVVCSPLTSLPEVAGDAALYLEDFSAGDFARCLRAVATDAALRTRLIDAGIHRAGQFRWEDTARKTAEIYRSAAERPADGVLVRRSMFRTLLSTAIRDRLV